MENSKEVQIVKLSEIDDSVITPIREVKKNSKDYRKLAYAIGQDGQKHPITLRELTEEEKTDPHTKDQAKYGIIDGHHRYNIAQDKGEATIMAVFNTREEGENTSYRDKVEAYRLNESAVKMRSLEKGKVIYELTKETNKDIGEIGEEVFGLKKTMSYSSLNKYKKSIGEKTIEKPRKNQFSNEKLQEALGKLPHGKEDIAKEEEQRTEQIKAVKMAQEQLKYLKAMLGDS